VAKGGNLIDEDIKVAALRRRSAKLLAGARCVVVPSEDARARIRRYFPSIRPVVQPHEDDTAIEDPPPVRTTGPFRVCVIGAIGVHKGFQVLLDCARDADARDLPLEFVVAGHTIDDRALLATGRVFVTGPYGADEAVTLIKAQHANLALLPSIFPETWSFALGEAWQAGLRVVAFDIGAQAERIRRTCRGILLPLGLFPTQINNALVAEAGSTRHELRLSG
jgi:glycosyltransferase involved in cell wall biosynthesis